MIAFLVCTLYQKTESIIFITHYENYRYKN